ncbi:MAG TPA: hypothetical protein VK569_06975 [Bacteroidota bacterium]|nr:hypothetical protein [Bacteroidota bacterium]
MTPKLDSCQIRGAVVETIETGGRLIVRLSVTGGSLDFISENNESFHLGDTLVLDGEFRPCSVKHALDIEDSHAIPDADFLS